MVRVISTIIVSVGFVLLCLQMRQSVYGDLRLLAGPLGFYRGWGADGNTLGWVVFSIPWSLGEGQYEREVLPAVADCTRQGREMNILKFCPHDAKAAAALPPYYEVVTQNHYQLLERFPPTHRFFDMWYEGEPVESDLLPVSEAMYREYPITCSGNTLVRDDIFEVLSPFLERPFFGIKEFSF